MLIFEDIIVAYLCKDYLNFLSNIQFGIFYSLHENDIPLKTDLVNVQNFQNLRKYKL